MSLVELVDTVQAWPAWLTYAALFGGAFIEYVFPIAPGDLFVVGGAVLVTAFGWSLWPVLAVVTLGALLGCMVDHQVGRWLVRSGRLGRLKPRTQATIGTLVESFERRGATYLVVNRFVPGVRALFLVASGIAGLSRWHVLIYSGISALAWNGLLLGAGALVGSNIEELDRWLSRYTAVALSIVAVVIGALWWRWRRARQAASLVEERGVSTERDGSKQVDDDTGNH